MCRMLEISITLEGKKCLSNCNMGAFMNRQMINKFSKKVKEEKCCEQTRN